MNGDTTAANAEWKATSARLDRDELTWRAYELWVNAGRPVGQDLQSWLNSRVLGLCPKAGQVLERELRQILEFRISWTLYEPRTGPGA